MLCNNTKQQHMTHSSLFTQFNARLVLAVALVAMCFTAQAQRLNNNNGRQKGTVTQQIINAPINNTASNQVEQLLDYAFKFRGTPYRFGASSPRGFDCSGFTSYVFRKFGVSLNRSSRGQVNNGRRITRNELKPGDLVFFNGRARGGRIGHVGIVTETNGDGTFKFIHSACSRGVSVSHSTESYYRSRYMGACRVIE